MDPKFAPGLPLAFHGTVIHSLGLNDLEILENCFLLVDHAGKIQALQADVDPDRINTIVSDHGYAPDVFPVKRLRRGQFICEYWFPIAISRLHALC